MLEFDNQRIYKEGNPFNPGSTLNRSNDDTVFKNQIGSLANHYALHEYHIASPENHFVA